MGAAAPTRALVACSVLGCALLLLGLVLLVGLPAIMREVVAKNVRIQPGSMLFSLWKDLPIPFYFSIYLFEVLNPSQILAGKKPVVQQRGPYVYREYREKKNITFYENDTVSFLEYRHFQFQPELSNGTEEDYISMPNLLVLGASVLLENQVGALRLAASLAFTAFKQKAFLNRTVGEILWGYEDPLVKFLNTIKPGLIPYGDKFGLIADFNNSNTGRFKVNSGVNDISKVHMVETWNGFRELPYWRSKQCNGINGTYGELWPPFRTPSSPLELYSPEMCRSLNLQFQETGEFHGLPIHRYVPPKTWFANGTDYPPNEGFCPCRQSGIQNLSSCRHIPMFVSHPHFLYADPELLETVDGLHPSEEKHGFFVEIHPMIGVPLNVSIKLQLSLYIKQVARISQTGRIKPVVMPILWFEESAVVTDELLNQFYPILVLAPIVMGYVQYCALGLGGVLLITTAFLWIRTKKDVQAKALQTVDPQYSEPQDPANAPLLEKELSPNIHKVD